MFQPATSHGGRFVVFLKFGCCTPTAIQVESIIPRPYRQLCIGSLFTMLFKPIFLTTPLFHLQYQTTIYNVGSIVNMIYLLKAMTGFRLQFPKCLFPKCIFSNQVVNAIHSNFNLREFDQTQTTC